MTNTELILEKLNEVLVHKQRFNDNTEEGDFNRITALLSTLQNQLREHIQSETSEQISEIIEKLESDATITDADIEVIRLWLVSDAEFYVRMENDYQGWLGELNRLFSVIEEVQARELTIENMGKISGTVRDAIRVIGDIVYFKQQKKRINAFENASKDLNSKNKIFLADILKEKLASDQM